jgi:hypothetical protein
MFLPAKDTKLNHMCGNMTFDRQQFAPPFSRPHPTLCARYCSIFGIDPAYVYNFKI